MAKKDVPQLDQPQLEALAAQVLEDDTVGFLTRSSVRRELREKGVPTPVADTYSKQVTGAITRQMQDSGHTWERLRGLPLQKVEIPTPGQEGATTTIYYNSNVVDEDSALRRFEEYSLATQAEEERKQKDREAAVREASRKKEDHETTPRSMRYILVVPYQFGTTAGELSDYLNAAEENSGIATNETVFQVVPDIYGNEPAPLQSLLPDYAEVGRTILERGASTVDLEKYAAAIRKNVVAAATTIEQAAPEIAAAIIRKVESFPRRSQVYAGSALVQRAYVPFVEAELQAQLPPDGRTIFTGTEDTSLPFPSYQGRLLQAWSTRYDAHRLAAYQKEAASLEEGTPNVQVLQEVLAIPHILERIQSGETLPLADGSKLTREQMDELLLPLALSKTSVYQAFFAEIMRVALLGNKAYKGSSAEEYGIGLGFFAENFNADEIAEILRFRRLEAFTAPIDAQLQQRKAERIKAERAIKANKKLTSKQRDQALEDIKKNASVGELRKQMVEAEKHYGEQIHRNITLSLGEKLGAKHVHYDEYVGGTESIAYKRDMEVYQQLVVQGKFALEPNPQDYAMDERGIILAYLRDASMGTVVDAMMS